ncbi:MAG: phosphodiesterase [Clostridia bacterium]|nr:phosphodiesterase [Clostridia bacterium]
MKVMCISDIHGNIECLNRAIERYREENAEKLIILGDFSSYYFSSSDFEVAEILNNMAGAIIAVKGNCDSTQADELFNFSLGYLKTIDINGIKVTLTHGHIYNRNSLPENCGKIFLSGHTHIGMLEQIGERIIANPGSISKPRGGTKKSYIIIDEEKIKLKSLDGELIKSIRIDNEFSFD